MSNDFFADLNRLWLAGSNIEAPAPPPSAISARGRVRGEFLKGPVPLAWLSAASKLPGKAALAVGLALWFEAGRRRSQTVTLTSAILARFGVNRKAKYRGLASLERTGLIDVVRVPRRNPVVTILVAGPEKDQIYQLKKGNQANEGFYKCQRHGENPRPSVVSTGGAGTRT
jgi:hypothetical protein